MKVKTGFTIGQELAFSKTKITECLSESKLGKETWVSVDSLIEHIKNIPDNNVKWELMSLLGGY